jgi:FixJ family two-component response regulator
MSSLAMSTPALNPFPPIKPKFDEANLGNVVYLIASDARLCDIPLSELTAAGVKIRHFGCASEFLNCVREDSAACIISDLQPTDMTAFDLQRLMTEQGGPPTVFIGVHPDIRCGIRAVKDGAVDCLLHPVDSSALIGAVNEAFRRDRTVRRRRAEIAALDARHLRLTRREREVFALVVRGFLNKQVAGMLTISLVTVQIHRSNMMRKMGARSFADLVCMAVKLKILDQELVG